MRQRLLRMKFEFQLNDLLKDEGQKTSVNSLHLLFFFCTFLFLHFRTSSYFIWSDMGTKLTKLSIFRQIFYDLFYGYALSWVDECRIAGCLERNFHLFFFTSSKTLSLDFAIKWWNIRHALEIPTNWSDRTAFKNNFSWSLAVVLLLCALSSYDTL